MEWRDWDTSCACECVEVYRPRVNENTNQVVREAQLLAPTDKLPHGVNEDGS